MENLLLLMLTILIGSASANDCTTISAANWTWPDSLISKWLINPPAFRLESELGDECGSSIMFQNLRKNQRKNSTFYGTSIDYRDAKNAWFDESYLDGAKMENSTFLTLRISNSILTESSFPKSLESLYLKNVSIEVFPKLYFLHNMKTVSARNISIKSLNLGELHSSNLQSIEITNGILAWFRVSNEFESLRNLDLHDNELQTLPQDLGNLVVVEKLNFSKNHLEFLEMDLFDGLDFLKDLDLSFNHLTVSTFSPVQLPALQRLALDNCKLNSLDVLYWQMPNLKMLNLEYSNKLIHVMNLRNHFSKDTVIKVSNNYYWCCNWFYDVQKHFKLERKRSPYYDCQRCSESIFNNEIPERSAEEQFRIEVYRKMRKYLRN